MGSNSLITLLKQKSKHQILENNYKTDQTRVNGQYSHMNWEFFLKWNAQRHENRSSGGEKDEKFNQQHKQKIKHKINRIRGRVRVGRERKWELEKKEREVRSERCAALPLAIWDSASGLPSSSSLTSQSFHCITF